MADRKNSFVSRPVYPGGKRAMNKFIRENLRYPSEALQAGVEGKVRIRYSLDYRGVVVATKVKSGIGHGCDEEAERVVQLLRFEVPQDRKRKVRIHQDIEINFKLDRRARAKSPAATPGSRSIQYHITPVRPAPENADQPDQKPQRTYHYTLRLG